MEEIKINPVFRDLIPPLADEEFKQRKSKDRKGERKMKEKYINVTCPACFKIYKLNKNARNKVFECLCKKKLILTKINKEFQLFEV